MEGAGGGYIAYRVVLMPPRSGLSNVRCGATLEELHAHLEQEIRRENQSGRRAPHPAKAHSTG